VLEIKCRSMRNNIVISGLKEEEEDSTITEQKPSLKTL
jgi:hypothetical protein